MNDKITSSAGIARGEAREEAGIYLRSLREAAGLTQHQVMEGLGYNFKQRVSQLERGVFRLAPEHWSICAHLFGVDLATFSQQLLALYDPLIHAAIFTESRATDVLAEAT